MYEMKLINPIENRDYKHQNKERLCYCCDTLQPKKEFIHNISIQGRGHGSSFDGDIVEINLCNTCKDKIKEEWINEQCIMDEYVERYKHEEKLKEFINTFILENQEYIYNCDSIIRDERFRESRESWIRTEREMSELVNNTATEDCDNYISKLSDKNNELLFNEYNNELSEYKIRRK